jgi:hypothetical protein
MAIICNNNNVYVCLAMATMYVITCVMAICMYYHVCMYGVMADNNVAMVMANGNGMYVNGNNVIIIMYVCMYVCMLAH